MSDPISIKDVDLTPIPGKSYFSIDREWREEFIYFLMVDRFQDAGNRSVISGTGRTAGVDTPDAFFGGKIAGITRNLDYIAGLGCTVSIRLWRGSHSGGPRLARDAGVAQVSGRAVF